MHTVIRIDRVLRLAMAMTEMDLHVERFHKTVVFIRYMCIFEEHIYSAFSMSSFFFFFFNKT